MISESFISELLDRADIVEVISRHVRLKKAGSDWSGLCPFHSEKTPSFTVSPSKQFYHCFGCGAHGNVIDFLMKQAGHGFVEAIESLAGPLGMIVPRDDRHDDVARKEARSAGLTLMDNAARHYQQQLKASPTAVDYLKSRGLTGQTAAQFRIGYAPSGFNHLTSAFPDVPVEDLVSTGLMIRNERGQLYDRFRNRVMFPIIDDRGRPIGFGARSLDGSEPKYLNSPETTLFSKGRELYGFFQAKPCVIKAGYCWVTEGYFDVLSLVQAGIGHVVASLGTAVTADQLRKLLRHTDKLYFCFDGDAAGQKAAVRLLPIVSELATDRRSFFFLFLPPGEDPDSFIRTHGRERFDAMKGAALPLSRFLLQQWLSGHDLDLLEERASMLSDAGAMLSKMVQAPALRSTLVAELAEKTGLRVEQIESLLSGNASRRRSDRRPATQVLPISLVDRMLSILLIRPAWRRRIAEAKRWLNPSDPADSLLIAAVEIEDDLSEVETDLFDSLMKRFDDEAHRERLSRVAGFRRGCDLTDDELEAEFVDGIAQIEAAWTRKELGRYKRLAETGDLTEAAHQEMMGLMRSLAESSRGPGEKT